MYWCVLGKKKEKSNLLAACAFEVVNQCFTFSKKYVYEAVRFKMLHLVP